MSTMFYWSALILLALVLMQLWRVEAALAKLSDTQYRIVRKLDIDLDRLDPPSDEVRQLAKQPGKEIEAIRAYRKQTGVGLKQARTEIRSLASVKFG